MGRFFLKTVAAEIDNPPWLELTTVPHRHHLPSPTDTARSPLDRSQTMAPNTTLFEQPTIFSVEDFLKSRGRLENPLFPNGLPSKPKKTSQEETVASSANEEKKPKWNTQALRAQEIFNRPSDTISPTISPRSGHLSAATTEPIESLAKMWPSVTKKRLASYLHTTFNIGVAELTAGLVKPTSKTYKMSDALFESILTTVRSSLDNDRTTKTQQRHDFMLALPSLFSRDLEERSRQSLENLLKAANFSERQTELLVATFKDSKASEVLNAIMKLITQGKITIEPLTSYMLTDQPPAKKTLVDKISHTEAVESTLSTKIGSDQEVTPDVEKLKNAIDSYEAAIRKLREAQDTAKAYIAKNQGKKHNRDAKSAIRRIGGKSDTIEGLSPTHQKTLTRAKEYYTKKQSANITIYTLNIFQRQIEKYTKEIIDATQTYREKLSLDHPIDSLAKASHTEAAEFQLADHVAAQLVAQPKAPETTPENPSLAAAGVVKVEKDYSMTRRTKTTLEEKKELIKLIAQKKQELQLAKRENPIEDKQGNNRFKFMRIGELSSELGSLEKRLEYLNQQQTTTTVAEDLPTHTAMLMTHTATTVAPVEEAPQLAPEAATFQAPAEAEPPMVKPTAFKDYAKQLLANPTTTITSKEALVAQEGRVIYQTTKQEVVDDVIKAIRNRLETLYPKGVMPERYSLSTTSEQENKAKEQLELVLKKFNVSKEVLLYLNQNFAQYKATQVLEALKTLPRIFLASEGKSTKVKPLGNRAPRLAIEDTPRVTPMKADLPQTTQTIKHLIQQPQVAAAAQPAPEVPNTQSPRPNEGNTPVKEPTTKNPHLYVNINLFFPNRTPENGIDQDVIKYFCDLRKKGVNISIVGKGGLYSKIRKTLEYNFALTPEEMRKHFVVKEPPKRVGQDHYFQNSVNGFKDRAKQLLDTLKAAPTSSPEQAPSLVTAPKATAHTTHVESVSKKAKVLYIRGEDIFKSTGTIKNEAIQDLKELLEEGKSINILGVRKGSESERSLKEQLSQFKNQISCDNMTIPSKEKWHELPSTSKPPISQIISTFEALGAIPDPTPKVRGGEGAKASRPGTKI